MKRVFLLALLAAVPAYAAEHAVQLTNPPALRGTIAAMPEIAKPADEAERRINAALERLDANVLTAADDCPGTDWTRMVEAPMRGPIFLSFVMEDSYFCEGAAHPETATTSIVYDLATGRPVDWARLLPASLVGTQTLVEEGGSKTVTLASKRLFALYMAKYTAGGATGQDLADCKAAIRAAGDPPPMTVWLDAKQHGLAVEIELPHAMAACEDLVIVPASQLKAGGASQTLLRALQ